MSERIKAKINRHGASLWYDFDTVYHTFDFHAHDEYEIFYFQTGEVQYYLEDKAYSMVPGDMLVIPPSVMHRAVIVNENAVYQRFIMMLSNAYCCRLLKGVNGMFINNEVPPMHISLGGEEQEDFVRKLNQMMELEDGPEGQLAWDSLCTLLLLQLQEYAKNWQEPGEEPARQAQEIVRYLNANFTKNIMLEDVAKHFFISKTHLMRQFKKYTHTSVHNYITTKRILLAKALMKENIPLAEVAEACGFVSYASFYQAFLHHTGICPTRYVSENDEEQG